MSQQRLSVSGVISFLGRWRVCCLGIVLLILAHASFIVAADSPTGIKLPYPLSLPAPLESDSLFAGSGVAVMNLTLDIDDTGVCSNYSSDQLTTSAWRNHMQEYLSRLRFSPGEVSGKKSPMQVIARLSIDLPDSMLFLEFPLDTLGRVRDPLLYEQNLVHAGVQIPGFLSFPWYHAVFKPGDSSTVLPWVLLSVRFDRNGYCTANKLIGSNYPGFKQQLQSASMYGRYQSGQSVAGKPLSRAFILATFFPTSHYPTKPWSPESYRAMDLHDRLGLRMLVDTGGLMIPPIPRARTPYIINIKLPRPARKIDTALRVRIGEDGRLRTFVSPINSSGFYPLSLALENQLIFYSAVGFDGRPRPFETTVLIRPEGESSVRISFPWLSSVED